MAEAGAPEAAQAKRHFKPPTIADNSDGWGPCSIPEQFKDIPYQPFAKGDRLGKAADFSANAYQGKQNRYMSYFGAGDAYAYFHEDESAFQLVDTARAGKAMGGRRRWQNRGARRDLHRARDDRRLAGLQPLSHTQKARDRDRQRMALERKWQKKWAGRQRRWHEKAMIKTRENSVEVRSTWEVLEEIDFAKLQKLTADPKKVEDLSTCGAVEMFDKQYDRITTKAERPLAREQLRTFHTVTTTDDPMIRKYTADTDANVFATDAILTSLMTATRSVYSWDLVVTRVGGKLFFDKRDESDFDYLTVSETAFEPPQDDDDSINSPQNLALEATFINQTYSQQCLRKEATHKMGAENPFVQDDEDVASVGYRYRKWDLGDIKVVARCEHDAFQLSKEGTPEFMNVKSLNEWSPRAQMDWRRKLDSQRGAVIATELKNNSYKLAKWTMASILADSAILKLAYIARVNPYDSQAHVILGHQTVKPKEFAHQITLSEKNCWGVLKHVAQLCLSLRKETPQAKFVILKDPMTPKIRIYGVPFDTFNSDDEGDDEDDGKMFGDDD